MSLNQSIARLKFLDSQHPDWGNLLLSDDVDPQMVADIVAVVRDAIAVHDPPFASIVSGEFAMRYYIELHPFVWYESSDYIHHWWMQIAWVRFGWRAW